MQPPGGALGPRTARPGERHRRWGAGKGVRGGCGAEKRGNVDAGLASSTDLGPLGWIWDAQSSAGHGGTSGMGVCRGRRWGCTFTTPPRLPTPTPAHRQLPFTFLQDPKQQRAFPRASVHCSTVLTPLYTSGVGSCPAPSTPFLVPRGHGAVGACSENGGGGRGGRTRRGLFAQI